MVPGCHGCQLLNGHLPKFLAVAMATLKSHQAYTLKVWQLVSTEEEEGLERQVKWPWYKDKIHTSTQLLALSPAISQTAYFHAGSVEFKRGLGKASEGLLGLEIKEGALLGSESTPESKLGPCITLPVPNSILAGLVVGASPASSCSWSPSVCTSSPQLWVVSRS